MNHVQQVLAAAAKIVSDFGRHDVTAYFSNFDEDATFVFYTHDERLNSRAEYEQLWNVWEQRDGFRVHGCASSNQLVQLIGESVGIFTHSVKTELEFSGERSTVLERETIVFELRNGQWIAVHEHLSPANQG